MQSDLACLWPVWALSAARYNSKQTLIPNYPDIGWSHQ